VAAETGQPTLPPTDANVTAPMNPSNGGVVATLLVLAGIAILAWVSIPLPRRRD
jgi:hypothetical protein